MTHPWTRNGSRASGIWQRSDGSWPEAYPPSHSEGTKGNIANFKERCRDTDLLLRFPQFLRRLGVVINQILRYADRARPRGVLRTCGSGRLFWSVAGNPDARLPSTDVIDFVLGSEETAVCQDRPQKSQCKYVPSGSNTLEFIVGTYTQPCWMPILTVPAPSAYTTLVAPPQPRTSLTLMQ